jgi:hypothetical protein
MTAPGRRCAVYTRKSSEEGLEQEFNSLDAQREACEAFIRSQRGEGWRLIETAYDDGGLSGGTLERPALKRLFADIAQHRVDTVVVYKVDRLCGTALGSGGQPRRVRSSRRGQRPLPQSGPAARLPDTEIVEAIAAGRQPADRTAHPSDPEPRLPLAWAAQKQLLGIA